MGANVAKTALDLLAPFPSWQLNRISPNTFPQDVVVTVFRAAAGQRLTDAEAAALSKLIRSGSCYRCRLGKGRFFFGDTPLAAAKAAVSAVKGKK